MMGTATQEELATMWVGCNGCRLPLSRVPPQQLPPSPPPPAHPTHPPIHPLIHIKISHLSLLPPPPPPLRHHHVLSHAAARMSCLACCFFLLFRSRRQPCGSSSAAWPWKRGTSPSQRDAQQRWGTFLALAFYARLVGWAWSSGVTTRERRGRGRRVSDIVCSLLL